MARISVFTLIIIKLFFSALLSSVIPVISAVFLSVYNLSANCLYIHYVGYGLNKLHSLLD